MEADSGFLALAKIFGFQQTWHSCRFKAVTSNVIGYCFLCKSTAAAPRKFFKKFVKMLHVFTFFKHIIYASERANEPRR